jgi:hypothetical protein
VLNTDAMPNLLFPFFEILQILKNGKPVHYLFPRIFISASHSDCTEFLLLALSRESHQIHCMIGIHEYRKVETKGSNHVREENCVSYPNCVIVPTAMLRKCRSRFVPHNLQSNEIGQSDTL